MKTQFNVTGADNKEIFAYRWLREKFSAKYILIVIVFGFDPVAIIMFSPRFCLYRQKG